MDNGFAEMKDLLQIHEVELVVPRLPAGLDGVRIIHLSDWHFRGLPQAIDRALAEALNATPADLLVFTGDAVNHADYWPVAQTWWSSIHQTPSRFAVPGNWDHVRGNTPERFIEQMAAAGFTTLINCACEWERAGVSLRIAGLDDLQQGQPDPGKAGLDQPHEAFTLLLAHQPDVLLASPLHFDLLLCGHTHGGQIRLPGLGAPVRHTRQGAAFVQGLVRLPRQRYVYISRGIGTGLLKLRLNCPPELPVIVLRCPR